MRMYRNMQSRINGVQSQKHHLYAGKCLLPRQDFYDWAFSSEKFHDLFSEWEKSGYNRRLTPSVDRINPDIGYQISNMEWVTHSENSRRGALDRGKSIVQMDKDGNVIRHWESMSEASKSFGSENPGNITMACKSKKTAYGFKWSYVQDH